MLFPLRITASDAQSHFVVLMSTKKLCKWARDPFAHVRLREGTRTTELDQHARLEGFYRDDHHRDAQSTHTSKGAAIVQALHLERRQNCRIQIIEGQNGELIDRETFEREHLKKPPRYLRRPRLGGLGEGHAP
jgi:hypothetical protein